MNWRISTIPQKLRSLADVLKGVDVFIGLSGPYVLNHKMVKSMAKNSVVFTLSNPSTFIQSVDSASQRVP
jgi:malic enzyme